MVPSITDLLNELLTAGVTELYASVGRDPQTELAHMDDCPAWGLDCPGRCGRDLSCQRCHISRDI